MWEARPDVEIVWISRALRALDLTADGMVEPLAGAGDGGMIARLFEELGTNF